MDRLVAHGVTNIVVNVVHLGEQIAVRLKGRAQIVHEERLLDTGDSVKNALPLLSDGPFFVLNGDGLWREKSGTIERICQCRDLVRLLSVGGLAEATL